MELSQDGPKQPLSIAERQEAIEKAFWENSEIERPESNSIDNIVAKCAEARVFLLKLREFEPFFSRASNILELGGGQGWASCIVKRFFPNAHVVTTDISPAAVASVPKWEHIYQVRVNEAKACRSYMTPFPSESFDLVFAYSAAHHFVKHKTTLLEIRRILRPQGAALYLNEPSCRAYIHRLAKFRVNLKRPEVPEDVLRYRELQAIGKKIGLDVEVHFPQLL